VLHDALCAWKERQSAENLTERSRQAILARVAGRPAVRLPHLASLFSPVPRLALAGGLPVLLFAVVLAGTWLRNTPLPTVDSAADAELTVVVNKVGGEVVFLIANGKPEFQVQKSSRPNDFTGKLPQRTTDGTYRDPLAAGPDLVFYRIE
jgi:hypothetical protein